MAAQRIRLDRPRRLALVGAAALALTGALIAAFAPSGTTEVPIAPGTAEDAPRLSYVRSLPDAGDPEMVRPVGLAVGSGRLFVADSGAAVVRVFSSGGFDMGTVGGGVLAVPAYVASDEATETLYVVDRELHAVLRFDKDGAPLGELHPSVEATAGWDPLGVAVDGEGSVAVTDSAGRHRMLLLDRNGDAEFSLGSAEASNVPGSVGVALDYPNSVAFSDGEIWVSDSNNRRVLVFDRSGDLQRFIRLQGVARGLTFLKNDTEEGTYVAVVDALASSIVLLDGDGEEVTRYGEPGTKAGQLAYPNDIIYDPDTSQLFVADTGNARVQVWMVDWPAPAGSPEAIAERLQLSAMRLFGLGLVVVALVVATAALWPARR